tara:strand:- start:8835 stop:9236 length:402 start_codon:yes stop_codon:yes gene_type:complete
MNNLQFTEFSELENILDAERNMNIKSSWNKLDKSTKLQKIRIYCDKYSDDNNKNDTLLNVLQKALEENKLQKIKDVHYNNDIQEIQDIPVLICVNNSFSIKNEKRISTSRNLCYKNKNLTKKNKHKIENKDKE